MSSVHIVRSLPDRRWWMVFLACSAFIFVVRWNTFGSPPGEMRDVAMYSVMAHEMLEGKSLYTDLWEHKPPGMFLLFAAGELLFGYESASIFFLGLAFSIASLVGVYLAAVTYGGAIAGLWAMATWAVISGDYLLEGHTQNAELFLNTFFIFALALLFRVDPDRRDYGKCLGIGVLIGACVLIKHFTIIFIPILFAGRILWNRRSLDRVKTITLQTVVMAVPPLLMAGGTVAYFYLTGRGDSFYQAVVEFNRFYVNAPLLENLVLAFNPRNFFFLPLKKKIMLITPLMLLCAWFAVRGLRARSETWWHWSFYALFVLIAIGLPGRWYAHYYQFWLPALSLAMGWGLLSLARRRALVGFSMLTLLIAIQLPYQIKYGRARKQMGDIERIGRHLREIVSPNEEFYAWTIDPQIFFYSKGSPASRHFWCDKLDRGPFKELFRKEVVETLSAKPPRIVVLDHLWCPIGGFPELARLLEKEYAPLPMPDPDGRMQRFGLYARKGPGSLE